MKLGKTQIFSIHFPIKWHYATIQIARQSTHHTIIKLRNNPALGELRKVQLPRPSMISNPSILS
jgi:hypothetical protein